MKKLTLLVCIFFAVSTYSFAQNDTTSVKKVTSSTDDTYQKPKNVFNFYPFPLIASSLVLAYERPVGPKTTVKAVGGYSIAEQSTFYNVENLREYYLELQLRRYMSREANPALKGVYAAPYLLFKNFNGEKDVFNGQFGEFKPIKTTAVSAGVMFGHQLLSQGGFVLDTYVGGGLMFSSGDHEQIPFTFINSYKLGPAIHIGISLGVAL